MLCEPCSRVYLVSLSTLQRHQGDEPFELLCMVPDQPDKIELVGGAELLARQPAATRMSWPQSHAP